MHGMYSRSTCRQFAKFFWFYDSFKCCFYVRLPPPPPPCQQSRGTCPDHPFKWMRATEIHKILINFNRFPTQNHRYMHRSSKVSSTPCPARLITIALLPNITFVRSNQFSINNTQTQKTWLTFLTLCCFFTVGPLVFQYKIMNLVSCGSSMTAFLVPNFSILSHWFGAQDLGPVSSRQTFRGRVCYRCLFTDMRISSSMYEVFNWTESRSDPPLTPAKLKRASLSLPPTTDVLDIDSKPVLQGRDTRLNAITQRSNSGEF